MIWAILALVGVPLWLCAVAISVLVLRNRKLRKRPGSMPVRIRVAGKGRWHPGHGFWVHDVFAFRGSPAAWKESLVQVGSVAAAQPATEGQKKGLHRLGDDPVVASFALVPEGSLQLAAHAEHASLLLGPFGGVSAVSGEDGVADAQSHLRRPPDDNGNDVVRFG
jgi:hypothetical protein